MAKYFSKIIDRYFTSWIRIDTWYTSHSTDMERFYKFIKALHCYSRKPWEPVIRNKIIEAVQKEHPTFDEEHLFELAAQFSSIAHQIKDYESTSFPDPIIEMKDPYEIERKLQNCRIYKQGGQKQSFYTENQIEEILEKNFGTNWRDRYNRFKRPNK